MQNHIVTKLQTFIIAIVSACFLYSCSDEDDTATQTPDQPQKKISNAYSIPEDSALAYLNEFLKDSDDKASRGASNRTVASITPIKYSQVAGKATRSDVNCENLVYIANFENEQGYAILAADERIGEKVIAVTDEGSLSESTVYSAMQQTYSDRIIVHGYPTTGPGFFTTPETGDEIFMNPNTVSLYIESEQDTLVGNFELDEDDTFEYAEYNISTKPIQSTTFSAPKVTTSSLCVSYAVNEVNNYNINQQLPPVDNSGLINFGVEKPITTVETQISPWNTAKRVYPMLYQFKPWRQSEYLNDLYPERRKYLIFGKKRKAPAGCFPMAISKIMTYFEYPKYYTHNGYAIDWKELKNYTLSNNWNLSAAHLLKSISSGCKSWYFYNGTFTFPKRASSYMKSIGFKDAHRHSYKFDRVEEMLDNGKPLIIYSIPGFHVFKGHVWNIDGYIIKKRTITKNTFIKNELTDTKVTTETSYMVHCDFGWGGNSNGYYVSGVFDLSNPNVEHDPGTKHDKTTNYNHHIRIITY